MRHASIFLSHASTDKELVHAVADELVRRGIVTWLDREELLVGDDLTQVLAEAVKRQATVTLFLSAEALTRPWVNDELRAALDSKAHLLPVFLGDPLKLVSSHPLLRSRWLHADGDRVSTKGIADTRDPAEIARQIARAVIARVVEPTWSDVAIVLDHRGDGRDAPQLPGNVEALDIPALWFRPRLGDRDARFTLTDADWDTARAAMKEALGLLGTLRGDPRKVRILGYSQAGFPWFLGRHFDRATTARIYAYSKEGVAVTNAGQPDDRPLTGGDPHAAELIHAGTSSAVALGIGSADYKKDLVDARPEASIFWIDPGRIDTSEQAMQLARNVVAFAQHARDERGARELQLAWATANHVAPLVAANFRNLIDVRYLEWDHAASRYVVLGMA